MKLTQAEEKHLEFVLAPYISDEKVQEMKNYVQHGNVSTYEHVSDVTKLCYLMNTRLHLGADEKTLLAGAFLHDFYLYDWHTVGKQLDGLHGYVHADIAARNAKKRFDIDDKVHSVIKTHMWPLNLTAVPSSKEAWILTTADKVISIKETLFKRKILEKN